VLIIRVESVRLNVDKHFEIIIIHETFLDILCFYISKQDRLVLSVSETIEPFHPYRPV